ncbi:MAG: acyloxyacyl hydrolase [Prevotella sp.]|nr:acyloxyacyl hydrolase [Prevotella sp.]
MKILLAFLFIFLATPTLAEEYDSTFINSSNISYEFKANPGKVLALDQYVKKWLKENNTYSLATEIHYTPSPCENNQFAEDYNYPTFSVGLRYSFNHATMMHRDADPAWGQLEPVDYNCYLGDILTLYGTFSRPVFRSSKWELAYFLGGGIGYSHKKYNKTDQIDNEFIGSHLNIFFTAGISATYYIAPHWGLKGGIDFSHHSNGALYRPNKGINYLGPFLGTVYFPSSDRSRQAQRGKYPTKFQKSLFAEFSLGIGAKTLLEDWQQTQFNTPPDNSEYRTDHFHIYTAYSFQADILYRYARRWASGIGIDVFYGTYSDHIRDLDHANGYSERHSPWSVGLAAKHETFYKSLSVRVGLGYYLFRQMGHSAKEIEKPYYERVGLHYSFPKLGNLSFGFNVNAHLTKADFTELQISYPIKL